jgi:hypothetical protein
MAEVSQTYKNHVRFYPPFHFFVLPVLVANVINYVRLLLASPTLGSAWAVVVAAALLMVAFLSRVQANTVQDRVIRLEMRLRLMELLPADLKGRINELTRGQLVALRFAGDAELPGLVQDVLVGKLKTKREIKMRVRDWQADWLRA